MTEMKLLMQLSQHMNKKSGAPFTGKYLGVAKASVAGTFKARIRMGPGCPRMDLGTYRDAKEAARAYDRAAIKKLALKAKTNFPLADYLELFGENFLQTQRI
jgi:hypothetical protein